MLDLLPIELMLEIFIRLRGCGRTQSILASTCKTFRKLWQPTVEALGIFAMPLTMRDLLVIGTCYAGVTKLVLWATTDMRGGGGCGGCGLPMGKVVEELGQSLDKLTDIEYSRYSSKYAHMTPDFTEATVIIPDVDEPLSDLDKGESRDVLASIASNSNLRTRLTKLTINDECTIYGQAELDHLASLTSLTDLSLRIKGFESDVIVPYNLFQSVQNLGIYIEYILPSPLIYALGTLTNLATLIMYTVESAPRRIDETDIYDPIELLVFRQLTNLRQFSTNYILPGHPVHQYQMFSGFRELRKLRVEKVQDNGALELSQYMTNLEEVESFAVLDIVSLLALPKLRRVFAMGMAMSPDHRLQLIQIVESGSLVMKSSLVEDLDMVGRWMDLDEMAMIMPILPLMKTLTFTEIYDVDNPYIKYVCLAKMLQRHAPHLQKIILDLKYPFDKSFPDALPSCTRLSVSADKETMLQLANDCALPALRYLRLFLHPTYSSVMTGQDFVWIKERLGIDSSRGVLNELELVMVGGGRGAVGKPLKLLRKEIRDVLDGSGIDVRIVNR